MTIRIAFPNELQQRSIQNFTVSYSIHYSSKNYNFGCSLVAPICGLLIDAWVVVLELEAGVSSENRVCCEVQAGHYIRL